MRAACRWSGLTVGFCLLLGRAPAPAAEGGVGDKRPNSMIVLSGDHGIEYVGYRENSGTVGCHPTSNP